MPFKPKIQGSYHNTYHTDGTRSRPLPLKSETKGLENSCVHYLAHVAIFASSELGAWKKNLYLSFPTPFLFRSRSFNFTSRASLLIARVIDQTCDLEAEPILFASSMVTQTRRSARVRKPKKYSDDAFEGLNILDSGSNSPKKDPKPSDNISEDGEFVEEKQTNSEAWYPVNGAEFNEPEVDSASDSDAGERSNLSKRRSHPRTIATDVQDPQESFHSRGLLPPKKFKKKAVSFLAGSNDDDTTQVLSSRCKWAEDITLPHRMPNENGNCGMSHPFGYTQDKRLAESTSDWKWYTDGGGAELMISAQDITFLDSDTASEYYCWSQKNHKVLLGPAMNQKIYDLELLQPISLRQVWATAVRPTEGDQSEASAPQERNGWLINSGGRIYGMDWAPNQEEDTQYLAIASSKKPPAGHPERTAFEPTQPYAASIQIWAFASSKERELSFMDMTKIPRLVQVVCTEWGSVRRIQWCPVARSPAVLQQSPASIGLLAGIWSDGYVRILDVKVDPCDNDPLKVHGKLGSEYHYGSSTNAHISSVKYQGSAFASKPPGTICTCLTWLSSTSIVAGCANGSVAIWNIAISILQAKDSMTPETSTIEAQFIPTRLLAGAEGKSGAVPHFYHALHSSYILGLSSTYPLYPYFLLTTSMDGYTRFTDIRSPHVDYVTTARNRIAGLPIVYSPQIQSAIAAEDNDLIRALPLRRFFQSTHIARTNGPVMTLSAGKAHASLLAGSADGEVIVTNPIRRMLGRRDVVQWQQIWFKHEWVRAKKPMRSEGPPDDRSEEMVLDGEVAAEVPKPETELRDGISRITEGYKLQSLRLNKSDKGGKDGLVYSTIFEDEAAVTCVVWNPNVSCGGWAAAGMGSGLVRVEDLAID